MPHAKKFFFFKKGKILSFFKKGGQKIFLKSKGLQKLDTKHVPQAPKEDYQTKVQRTLLVSREMTRCFKFLTI